MNFRFLNEGSEFSFFERKTAVRADQHFTETQNVFLWNTLHDNKKSRILIFDAKQVSVSFTNESNNCTSLEEVLCESTIQILCMERTTWNYALTRFPKWLTKWKQFKTTKPDFRGLLLPLINMFDFRSSTSEFT